MSRHSPKISIITPAYNSEAYIEEAIESVLAQGYDNFEHIIIDGGSTDETVDILKRYSHLNIISEPDNGIYDALNKGLRKATGELIGWLNSDDLYANGAFDALVSRYREYPASEMVAGTCERFTIQNDTQVQIKKSQFTSPSEFQEGNITHGGTLLNGGLLTQALIAEVGGFNESLTIAGDTEYLIRIAAKQPKITVVSDVVYRYRQHEDSLTINGSNKFTSTKEQTLDETMRFMIEYANNTRLPSPLREYCLSSFRGRSGILFKEYVTHGRLKSALLTANYCTQRDAFWPVWMGKKFTDKYLLSKLPSIQPTAKS